MPPHLPSNPFFVSQCPPPPPPPPPPHPTYVHETLAIVPEQSHNSAAYVDCIAMFNVPYYRTSDIYGVGRLCSKFGDMVCTLFEYSNAFTNRQLIYTELAHSHYFCQWRRLPEFKCNLLTIINFCCWMLLHSSSIFIPPPSLSVPPCRTKCCRVRFNQPLRSEWHKVCGVGSYSDHLALLTGFAVGKCGESLVHNFMCPWCIQKWAKIFGTDRQCFVCCSSNYMFNIWGVLTTHQWLLSSLHYTYMVRVTFIASQW